MAGKKGIEGGKVAGFLGIHVSHEGAKVGMSFDKGWGLRCVD